MSNNFSRTPSSTGAGAGFIFQRQIALKFLIQMIRNEEPLPNFGKIQTIALQTADAVDDIQVTGADATGRISRLYIQAKMGKISFTASTNTPVTKALEQFKRQIECPDFGKNDWLGLGIEQGKLTNGGDINDLIGLARNATSCEDFYVKACQFKRYQRTLLNIKKILSSIQPKENLLPAIWRILKHLHILKFDFTSAGRDLLECHQKIDKMILDSTTNAAGNVYESLYCFLAENDRNAGTINRQRVKEYCRQKHFQLTCFSEKSSIAEILHDISCGTIEEEKKKSKYIPEIFVEFGPLKGNLRLFAEPILFLEHLLDELRRKDFFPFNRILTLCGQPEIKAQIPEMPQTCDYLQLSEIAENIRKYLDKLDQQVSKYNAPQEMETQVSDKFRTLFYAAERALECIPTSMKKYTDSIREKLRYLEVQFLLIVSKAGSGKTNLLCDFTEKFLIPRGSAGFFIVTGNLYDIQNLESSFLHAIRSEYFSKDLDLHLRLINSLAKEENRPYLLVLDAINEHPNCQVFSTQLKGFLEKCVRQYPLIRCLITCRSEFFDDRFGELRTASFSDQMLLHEKELPEDMTESHKTRLLEGYFQHFHLNLRPLSESLRQDLARDPLLLHIYCETSGDVCSKSIIEPTFAQSLSMDLLFEAYLKKKCDNIVQKMPLPLSGSRRTLLLQVQKAMSEIVEKMLNTLSFKSVFSENDDVSRWIDEDVLALKKDGSIGFVYDKVRDFLLAKHLLLEILPKDENKFTEMISKLTRPEQTISEGLMEFLFCYSRHHENRGLELLRQQDWFEAEYVKDVFILKPDVLTQDDAIFAKSKIREWLSEDEPVRSRQFNCAQAAIKHLYYRYETEKYPHLNLVFLLNILDEVDRNGMFQMLRTFIDIESELLDFIRTTLCESESWQQEFSYLIRLFLYVILFWKNFDEYDRQRKDEYDRLLKTVKEKYPIPFKNTLELWNSGKRSWHKNEYD